MAKLTPAVAYIRMSSDKQEASPKQQREEITALAKGRYKVVRWYIDEGISGADTSRAEFRRMISDASELQDFEAVLCWDQDRFSRFDPAEANYYWHTLRMSGVRIETVNQGLIDLEDLGGWLTASVNQHAKAQYLRDLSKKRTAGAAVQRQAGTMDRQLRRLRLSLRGWQATAGRFDGR